MFMNLSLPSFVRSLITPAARRRRNHLHNSARHRVGMEALESRTLMTSTSFLNPTAMAARAGSDDHANAPGSQATPVRFSNSGTATQNGALERAGDRDTFRIDITQQSSLRIQLNARGRGLDTCLYLYDANGRLLTSDDDGGGGTNSRLEGRINPGTYYIQVGAYQDRGTGRYQLQISRQGQGQPGGSRDDHVNTPGPQATPLTLGSNGSALGNGNLERAGDRDTFRFTMQNDGNVSIQLNAANGQFDTYLRVYNSQGQLIAENDDVSRQNLNSALSGRLPRGDYYIQAGSFQDTGSGQYQLQVTLSNNGGGNNGGNSNGFGIEIAFADNGLSPAARQQVINAARQWAQVITQDLPDVRYGNELIDDLRIIIRTENTDGPGRVLAAAGPTGFRSGSHLPFLGEMIIDVSDINRAGFQETMLHEMGHVFGLGTLWGPLGLLAQSGGQYYYLGQNAINEYNRLTGGRANAVPVESETGHPGSDGGHWSERVFDSELMTPHAENGGREPLSRMTIAALQDLGYSVNYGAAENYSLPGQSRSSLANRGNVTTINQSMHSELPVLLATSLSECRHTTDEHGIRQAASTREQAAAVESSVRHEIVMTSTAPTDDESEVQTHSSRRQDRTTLTAATSASPQTEPGHLSDGSMDTIWSNNLTWLHRA